MTKEEMNQAIGQMSYYNAAEGSWSSEASARAAHRTATAQKAIDAGLSYEQFEELYNSCDRQLTTFTDFAGAYRRLSDEKSV